MKLVVIFLDLFENREHLYKDVQSTCPTFIFSSPLHILGNDVLKF